MDLMAASTSYTLLETKYQKFAAPTARILVDGVDLAERMNTRFSGITADLSADYAASGISFDVIGEYRADKTEFDSSGAAKVLQLGAKVELELGYIRTEKVFSGLVTDVEYDFSGEDEPVIHVECMDAKCLLMKMQRLEIRSEKKIGPLVSALLSQSPVSAYLSGKQVSLTETEREPLPFNMDTDYDFLVRQAQYTGCEFFIFAGKAYFREPAKLTTPVMTLEPQHGILSATMSLRGAPLVKKITVRGVDPESDKAVSGSATSSGKFGDGSGPSKMLSGTERTYFDPRAVSAKDASDRAKAILRGIERQFGVLNCRCIGLPEIVPGRWIKVSGLAPQATGKFYIMRVRHVYSDAGFTTSFEARTDSL